MPPRTSLASLAKQQDAYTIESVRRAQAAIASGAFADEIVAVKVAGTKGDVEYATDEQPGKSDIAKIPTLKPAFRKDGTVTAASSSSISDGAAATILLSEDEAKKRGIKPLARIVGHATQSQEPEWFTTAPVGAIEQLLKKVGWKIGDVDLFEINEAFAVVAMAPIKVLGIPREKVNINGGACALGHPIGASGARLVVTLIHALKKTRRQARRRVAVHRRRRSDGIGDRADLIEASEKVTANSRLHAPSVALICEYGKIQAFTCARRR